MFFNTLWLILLLLIINYVKTKSIDFHENKCKTNGIFRCIYKIRYRRQNNFENLGARMLGEECTSNDECRRTPVDGTKICLSNQCQCSSGYIPIDAYRCIRDFEQQLSSNIQTTKSIEIEESSGYGSLCSKNADCQHSTVQLECFRGTCVCLEGYVPLGKYLCYNIHGQGAPIIQSSTSTSTFSTTITTTTVSDLPKSLGQTCINNDDCQQSILHSHCSNGKCTCINDYILLDYNTCIENKPIIDQNEDSTTLSNHYRSLLGGQCLTNRNCQTIDARCLNNICTCPIGSFPIDDWNCLKDLDSTKFETKTITKTTTATTTIATTVFQWWPWTHSTTTHQSKKSFHFRCVLNNQCINMDQNSHCTLGRCVCNVGYRLDITSNEQKCIQRIINEDNCD